MYLLHSKECSSYNEYISLVALNMTSYIYSNLILDYEITQSSVFFFSNEDFPEEEGYKCCLLGEDEEVAAAADARGSFSTNTQPSLSSSTRTSGSCWRKIKIKEK